MSDSEKHSPDEAPFARRAISISPLADSLPSQIIEHSPVGIAVFDYSGTFIMVNTAYAQIYGYEPSELLGRSFTMVFPAATHNEVLARHQAFLDQGGDLGGEWDVIHRDGTPRRVISSSANATTDPANKMRLVYVYDITERSEKEKLLQIWSSAFNHASIGIAMSDATSNTLVAVNPAFANMLGYSPEELINLSSFSICAVSERERGLRLFQPVCVRDGEGQGLNGLFPAEALAPRHGDAS